MLFFVRHNNMFLFWMFLFVLFFTSCKNETETGNTREDHFIDTDSAVYILPDENASLKEIIRYASHQWSIGNYDEALNFFSNAYEQAKKENDEAEMAMILNNLGLVYWSLDDNESAMEYYRESAKLAEKHNMKRLLGLTYTNRGLVLRKQKNYDEALTHNDKAIDIFKETENTRDLAISYNNQGQIFKVQEEMDLALYYYQKALEIYQTIQFNDGMSATYHNLSEVYSFNGQKELSLNSAYLCLQTALMSESKVRIGDAYKKLSVLYEHFNEIDSALHYQQKYADYRIETLMTTYSKQLAESQTKMKTEIKNLRISNLEKENMIAGNRMWLTFITSIAVFLVIAFGVYRHIYKSKLKKQQLELELKNSNDIIRIKEKELKSYIFDLSNKNKLIGELQNQLSKEIPADEQTTKIAQLLNQRIVTDENWSLFKSKFNVIYPFFFAKIKQLDIHLTEAEVRFLVLFKLNLSGKEMANMLGISQQSVRALKMRMKRKLNLKGYERVEDFVQFLS